MALRADEHLHANPSPSSTLAIANVLQGVASAGTSVWAVGFYYTSTGIDAGDLVYLASPI